MAVVKGQWLTTPLDYTPAPDANSGAQDSVAQAVGRKVVHEALPTVAGGFGASAGAEAGAAVGALGGPIAEFTVPAGALIGGVAGALGAGSAAEATEDTALSAAPGIAQAIGQSESQLNASAEVHPLASYIGGLLPQVALLHPDLSTVTDLLKLGTRESGAALAKVAGGAAIQGGIEATNEYLDSGQINPERVALSAATGGLLHEEWGLGGAAGRAGRSAVDSVLPDSMIDRINTSMGRAVNDEPTPNTPNTPDPTRSDYKLPAAEQQGTDLLALPSPRSWTDDVGAQHPAAAPAGPQLALPNPDTATNYVDPNGQVGRDSSLNGLQTQNAPLALPAPEPLANPAEPGSLHPAAAPPGPALALPNPDTTARPIGSSAPEDDFTHGNILTALRTANPKADGSPAQADSFTLKTANKIAGLIQAGDADGAHAFVEQARTALETDNLTSKTIVARTNILDAAKATVDKFEARQAPPAPEVAPVAAPEAPPPEIAPANPTEAFAEQAEQANETPPPEGAKPGEPLVMTAPPEEAAPPEPAEEAHAPVPEAEGPPSEPAPREPDAAPADVAPVDAAAPADGPAGVHAESPDTTGERPEATDASPQGDLTDDRPARLSYEDNETKVGTLFKSGLIDAKTRAQLTTLVQQQNVSPMALNEMINEAAAKYDQQRVSASFGGNDSETPPEPAAQSRAADPNAEHSPDYLAKAPQIATQLRGEMDRIGLHKVGLELHDQLFDPQTGAPIAGQAENNVIRVALGGSDDPAATLHHEAVHVLRTAGAFSKPEWETLVGAAARKPEIRKFVEDNYSHLAPDQRAEEGVAEMYSSWKANGDKFADPTERKPQPLMKRLSNIFSAIKNAFTKHGMTADSVFRKLDSGELASRDMAEPQADAQPASRAATPAEDEHDPMKVKASDIVEATMHSVERWSLIARTGRQLAGDYAKSPLKAQMDRLVDNTARSGGTLQDYVHEAAQPSSAWAELPKTDGDKIAKLVQEGTLANEDASSSKSNLNARFKELSPAAQQVFKDVMATFPKQRAEWLKVVTDLANKIPDEVMSREDKDALIASEKAKTKELSNYFPLTRHGDFINVAEKPSYQDAHDQVEKLTTQLGAMRQGGSSEAEVAVGQAKLDEAQMRLKSEIDNGNRISRAYESEAKQIAHARQLKEQGYEVRSKRALERDTRTDGGSSPLMNAVNTELERQIAADPSLEGQLRGLQTMLNQVYFSMSPETSAIRGNLRRQGVAGFDPDARRAYAQTTLANAHYLAALKHGAIENDIFNQMKKIVEAQPDNKKSADIYNEFKQRANLLREYANTPVTDFLTKAAYAYNLGLTPAFTFMHLMQTFLTTLPMMSAHFNPLRVSGELIKAGSEVFGKLGTLKEGMEHTIGKTDGEQQNIRYLMSHGAISGTDIGVLRKQADGTHGGIDKVGHTIMEVASFLPHYTEKANRMTTAQAAYRMAIQSPDVVQRMGLGLSHEQHAQILADDPTLAGTSREQMQAMRYAEKMTLDSHIDYDPNNVPRLFMQGQFKGLSTKILFQFQKYQQGMIHVLVSNAFKAMDKNLSGDERLAAAKTLLGIVGTHALMTGAMGLPGYGLLAFATNAYHKLLGDKDEPYNADDKFRTMLDRSLGKDAGDVFARGILYTPGIRDVLPGDVTDRLGMGDVLTPTTQVGDIDRDNYLKYMMSVMGGPAGSLIGNVFDAYNEQHQGDTWKAAEDLMPKVMRDVSRTVRFYEQGVTTSANNPVVNKSSLSPMDLTAQLLGFEPQKVETAYANRSAVMDAKTELDARRKILLKEYTDATIAGDSDRMDQTRQAIDVYNAKTRGAGLFMETIKGNEMMRSVMDRKLAGMRLNNGVALSPRQRALVIDYAENPPN